MRTIAVASMLVLFAPASVWAQSDDEEEEEEGDDEEEEEEDEEEDEEETAKPKAKPAAKDGNKREEFKKQDLRGHAVDPDKIANPFQKDRFFVDKVDTPKTAKGTLVQGSLQWSSFAYRESSGAIPVRMTESPIGDAASPYNRYFTEIRSQTDLRHIGGGKWDARLDGRLRYVPEAGNTSANSDDPTRIQSGFNGTPEVEAREAWIVRSGKRVDLFFGRQFVPDLGAIKIDGIRFDYAASEKITFLGFAGLYPVRGSRSLTTDYPKLRSAESGTMGQLQDAGRLVTAEGFGAAYRTINMHGAIGGVAITPLSGESPRIYATANGYYRLGPKLDFYHYGVLDVFGSAADPVALTNLSAGFNFKPSQRVRLTTSVHRVDTETLNVQAGAFLDNPVLEAGGGVTKVQNETILQLRRISSNSARGTASFGLGELNRFEITVGSQYRYRPDFTLRAPDGTVVAELEAAKGVDVFGGILDRRSLFDLRIGVDATLSRAVGDVAFSRSESLTTRGFLSREIGKGRGEWEAEVSYTTTSDRTGGAAPMCIGGTVSPADCYGASSAKILSAGGQVYYRIKQDWFGIANLYVSQMGLTRKDQMDTFTDPTITSLTGFLRIAYRY